MTKSIMRKLTADMTVAEKEAMFLSEPDPSLIMDFRFIDLLEFGNDVANRFKVIADDLRISRNGKMTISEVDELYKKFRKIAMNNDNTDGNMIIDSTKSDCLIDLTMSYGRHASQRLSYALNEKEQSFGRKLHREEILEEYRRIDEELCQKVMTRAGK
jgi:hypothetical protein